MLMLPAILEVLGLVTPPVPSVISTCGPSLLTSFGGAVGSVSRPSLGRFRLRGWTDVEVWVTFGHYLKRYFIVVVEGFDGPTTVVPQKIVGA